MLKTVSWHDLQFYFHYTDFVFVVIWHQCKGTCHFQTEIATNSQKLQTASFIRAFSTKSVISVKGPVSSVHHSCFRSVVSMIQQVISAHSFYFRLNVNCVPAQRSTPSVMYSVLVLLSGPVAQNPQLLWTHSFHTMTPMHSVDISIFSSICVSITVLCVTGY